MDGKELSNNGAVAQAQTSRLNGATYENSMARGKKERRTTKNHVA